MDKRANPFETLKHILRHARDPERLDDHPWTHSLIVRETLSGNPSAAPTSRGGQLLEALARLFPQLRPATPPRRGKRLDPRWGEFGLLAALYFTPFNHGTPFPTTLMDAWARIDEAILYFVFGKPADVLCEEDVKRYQLVGTELEYGSPSTLSDWHRKGLQRFVEIIVNRERFLARNGAESSIILNPEHAGARTPSRSRRVLWLTVATLLVLVLGLGSFKGWRIYERGRLVYQDIAGLQSLVRAPVEPETMQRAMPALITLQGHLSAFKQEALPVLELAPQLDWIPVYGGDLSSAPALIETAEHLLSASILASEAARPLFDQIDSPNSGLDPAGLTMLLVEATPQLEATRHELDQALTARETIEVQRLSPRVNSLVIGNLDPVLRLADEGLSLALSLPGVLGAGSDGPKTYLLLVQNEDELRPTGGFITSVGNLVLHNGRVISLDFEAVDNDVQEDWSKPYPAAPWQLREYMNSRVLILRDSNWFTDFPTSARWAEYLFAYTHSHSVDGVIAFDQHFLVMLLGVLGPLEVEGAPYPLTNQNVTGYMREAKIPPTGDTVSTGWYRKEFISKIADAILTDLSSGENHDWRAIGRTLFQALAERHLLLQFDDPVTAALSAARGWDNAVRAEAGDYLMVTDTNIGFNKTSAVVNVSLTYDVDLNDIAAPRSTLTVTHMNGANQDDPCNQWNTDHVATEKSYPINRCYWSYLRVYKQSGVELLEATPHAIPGDQMLLGRDVPARVDEVDEELPGVQGFGTLLVVPGGESWTTSFQFALAHSVLSIVEPSGEFRYHLHVQKQPGTLAVPLKIRIHLPGQATLNSMSGGALSQDSNLLLETSLLTDVEFEVTFTLP